VTADDLAERACAELQTGVLGEACIALMYALMWEETRRFTVLCPVGGWHREAVEDLGNEFFVRKVEGLTAELTVLGVTRQIVGKVLRRWIRNFLIDLARDTPIGRIRRKLEEDVLRQYAEFCRVPDGELGAGRWYLDGQPSYPYGGEFAPLIEAAGAVPGVKPVRWSGPRRAPMTSDASLRDIVVAVFSVAAGSLEVAQLVHVVAKRFPAAAEPEDVTVDDHTFARVTRALDRDPAAAAEIAESVSEVYEQLSPSQRALVPCLDGDVATVMQVLNVGRSRAYEAVERLRDLLDRLLPDDETRAVVNVAVVAMCGSA
jgi:hypothetical protein